MEAITNFFKGLFGSITSIFGSAPKSKFNLDKWKLELPVNSLGQLSGSMSSISPARTYDPWFIASSDKLVFNCPAKGATSGGSDDPRTELAQDGSWAMEKGGQMSGTLVVNKIPSGDITVAQVWSQSQALRLSVNKLGEIRAAGGGVERTLVGTVPLGTSFSFDVKVEGTTLYLKINGVDVFNRDMTPWAGKSLRFKAGAYSHPEDGENPESKFKLTYTDLKISN